MSRFVERFIAWRYLRSPRREGFVSIIAWFSFIGILLGVATLVVVMSVMNGFRSELIHRIIGFNGHLTVYTQGQPFHKEKAQALPNVVSVIPVLEKQGLCFTERSASGCIIRGMTFEDIKGRPLIAERILEGTLEKFTYPNAVIIGKKLARKLGVGVGETLKIMSAEGRATAFGMMPRTKHFQVVAIFQSGMYEYDSTFLFMPIAAGQSFFETPEIRVFEIFVKDPEHMADVKEKLSGPGMVVYDWKQSNSHFFRAIQIQSSMMFLILNLIVLVAVFNIVSCLVMLVKDKTKDIAVLRTLGATKGAVMRIFFFIGSFIGVSGTFIGTLLGLLFSHYIDPLRQGMEKIMGIELFQEEIYSLSTMPSKVEVREVAMIVLMALSFSFLSTLYPSWKASRLNPAEGLRYE